MSLLLKQHWRPGSTERVLPEQPDENGRPGVMQFTLCNLGPAPVQVARLCYASMTRLGRAPQITGAILEDRLANHVALSPGGTMTLLPGESWQIALSGGTHAPLNRSQGAMAAWIETPEGQAIPARCADLTADRPTGPLRDWPAGQARAPLAVLPWPAQVEVADWHPAQPVHCGAGLCPQVYDRVAGVHQRLFPGAPQVLGYGAGLQVVGQRADDLGDGAYALSFEGPQITLTFSTERGQQNGLITLAQILHGALAQASFQMPAAGQIADAPRFDWRGCHVDVARNFRPIEDLHRLVDILAWHRMNRLHLHLTDDEGWRLESRAFPDLTRLGARRGRDCPGMPPQYADGPMGQAGFYSQEQMQALVAHADGLGIEITPEIDVPGHATALLTAVPGLRDPDEPADSYRSVQGYPNNALNPALPRSYEVLETLLAEVCALFPGPIVHLGGDEVAPEAWAQSPLAQDLARQEGLAPGAAALQGVFMARAQQILAQHGKRLGGWDECADGPGITPQSAVLFAWRDTAKTSTLLQHGYDVVSTPGQAYYLDMVQATGWGEPGTSWAGAVSPQATYEFEPTADLPADPPGRLLGVQASIWSEHLNTRARWNHMVFPRLSAVAEAAWTPSEQKNWPCFAARARLMPQL